MKWQNKLLIGLALFNVCTLGLIVHTQVNAADSLVTIPILPKDYGYVIHVENEVMNPVTLENKLGLFRGAIREVRTDELGNIEIVFAYNVTVDTVKITTLNGIVNKSVTNIEVKK